MTITRRSGRLFEDGLVRLGGDTLVLDYAANTVDFTAQINNMRSFQPDLIYLSAFCAENASLVPQLRQQGFSATHPRWRRHGRLAVP